MELLFTLILAPLLVNLATKLISDWLQAGQGQTLVSSPQKNPLVFAVLGDLCSIGTTFQFLYIISHALFNCQGTKLKS